MVQERGHLVKAAVQLGGQVVQEPGGVLAALDRGRQALAEARTDVERVSIRNQARAAELAASVLKLREIEVSASILKADCERAIAAANPPVPPAERNPSGSNTPVAPVQQALPRSELTRIRQAHDMPEQDYERLKAEAVEKGQPLTRARIAQRAKQFLPYNAEAEEARRIARKDTTYAGRLQQRIDWLTAHGEEQADRIAELERENELLRAAGLPDDELRQRIEHWQERVRVADLSRDEAMRERNRAESDARYWKDRALSKEHRAA